MRDTHHQGENTASTKENLEDRYPFEGALQSDPALKGHGTKKKASLNEKIATDTALPLPQKRHFRD